MSINLEAAIINMIAGKPYNDSSVRHRVALSVCVCRSIFLIVHGVFITAIVVLFIVLPVMRVCLSVLFIAVCMCTSVCGLCVCVRFSVCMYVCVRVSGMCVCLCVAAAGEHVRRALQPR